MGSVTEPLQQQVIVRQLGVQPYDTVWHRMQQFTDQRTNDTIDEIWLVQHPAVFTQGQSGKAEHILQKTDIPIVQSDRGGQVTYHGLGQQVMYILVDIKRRKAMDKLSTDASPLSVRDLVSYLEHCVVNTLADYGIKGYPKPDAPGVYIDGKKICSLGLRIRKGCSFHGLAFNIDMDLSPFHAINPCGYAGLEMCRLQDFLDKKITCADVAPKLIEHFTRLIGYRQINFVDESSN